MLGATDTIMPYALSYGRIYVISCIYNVFNVTMNNIVASEGAAKTTMCALLLGAVLNIGLDPISSILSTWGLLVRQSLQQFLKWLLLLYI